MKIEKITYQQTFPTGPYMNVKLGMEIVVNGENVEDVFAHAKILCEETFRKLNPYIGEVHTTNFGLPTERWNGELREELETLGPPPIHPKENRINSIIRDINSCKEKKVLESYKLIAKTDQKLQDAYDKKMEEFV